MRNKLYILLSLFVLASFVLGACAQPQVTPEKIIETVVVEKEGQTVIQTVEVTAAPPPTEEVVIKAKDPTTFTYVTFGEPDSLDPAFDYETAGGEILQNVYETLVTYDGNYESKLVPLLAESWELSEDGKTYTFKMRSGVKYHNGNEMKASDVAYSFVRGLLQGGTDSPQFLIFEPFYGVGTIDIAEAVEVAQQFGVEALADGISQEEYDAIPKELYDDVDAMKAVDPEILRGVCEDLFNNKVVADDATGTVTMKLAQPWGPFLVTIAGYWSSVMDPSWVAENGGWDGSCDTWQNFYAIPPESNPINNIAMGTGPFKFDHWTPGEEIVMVRNDDYWREPAKLERVVIKQVDEWSTRFAMLQAGDADAGAVPVENRSQMDELVGEDCIWNEEKYDYDCQVVDPAKPFRRTLGKPGNTRSDVFFNFKVANPDGSNTYLGSGKLDGNGIPDDFFADVHIRKAFNYCFDWDTYINDVFNGEAVQSKSLAVPGMPGYNEDDPVYTFDLAKCEEEFKLADVDKDGIPAGEDPDDVWEVGFRMQGSYNQGNTTRQTIAEILAGNLNQVNEKFILEVVGLPWPAYLRSIRASLAPIFFVGWHEDFHDPHNWYVPYLVTTYAARQNIPAEIKNTFVPLINEGVLLTDPEARNEVYRKLNQAVYDNPPGIILAIGTSHGFMARYVHGVNYNGAWSNLYYYPMWKE
jgi:peptide/nickel transport system substrate-binding protein